MLKITNETKFKTTIETALNNAAKFPRWQNATKKAVAQIEDNAEFMEFDEKENYLLIWSPGSNEIYTANGVCQCKAFEQGYPCWHRAAARLVRNYHELPENKTPNFPTADNAPYIKQLNRTPTRCGNIRF